MKESKKEAKPGPEPKPEQKDMPKAQDAKDSATPVCPVATPESRIAELTDTLKRLQADFENHIKLQEKRQSQMCELASARVLVKVLSVVDEFERALKQLEDAKIDAKLLEGMRMVNKNVHAVLDSEGVRPIECMGKKLDPFRHEVLRKIKKEGVADDTIIEEHVRGYLLKDKVLRHSKVTVVSNGGN
jgi:molecular chaperone GrpE